MIHRPVPRRRILDGHHREKVLPDRNPPAEDVAEDLTALRRASGHRAQLRRWIAYGGGKDEGHLGSMHGVGAARTRTVVANRANAFQASPHGLVLLLVGPALNAP